MCPMPNLDPVPDSLEHLEVQLELIRRDASSAEEALDLLMIAKYLERIGDHAVNLAEWVEYSITGNKK